LKFGLHWHELLVFCIAFYTCYNDAVDVSGSRAEALEKMLYEKAL